MEFQNKFTTQNLQKYLDFLKAKGNSSSSIQRKLSSIASFENFLIKKQLIKFVKPVVSTSEQIKKKSNFNTILTRYLIFGSLIALFLGLVYSLYQQSLIKTRQNLAYSTATSPVKPTRILSFQGRLTDSVGNPITSSTPINFKLFDSSSAGTQLYDSSIGNSQSITPDENGIFNVIIGKTHGSEISQDVFSENPEVWLQITTGSEVMNPRQQIATVAYAINSETLQGLPPSSYGLKNTVLVIDNQGNLNLGETSPSIKSNSGTFTLEGQGVVIKTATSSNGNINFLPDGGGGVNFNSQATAPTSGGFVNFYNPSISSGNIFNSQILNTNRGYNFLSFQNYDIGTSNLSTRFSVGASGNVLANSLLLNQTLSVGSTALATNLNADLLDGFDSSYFNYNSVYYVEGNTTGVGGTWTGNLDNLANYYNGLKIAYKIGINGASTTRLDINGLGPVVVRRNNANLTTHLPVGTVVILTYTTISGTPYWVWADYDSNSNTYDRTYWGNTITAGATIYDYKLLMQASDGKWYPLTLEEGIGTNKTVSTIEFLPNSPILYYATTTNVAPNNTLINVYSEIPITTLNYTANQASWTNQLPIYLKGTINPNGKFVLDNSTYTSFITQNLPTTEDGFVYILLGQMYGTTSLRLFQYHPMYEYRFGKIQLYNPNSTDFVKKTGDIISGNLSVGGTFSLTQGAFDGYILTSDASGNSYWAANTGVGTTYTAGVGLSLTPENVFNVRYDSSLGVNGSNQLALNLANANTWTGVQRFTAAIGVTGNSSFTDNLSVGKTLTTTTLKATNAQDTTLVTNLNADLLDGKHATDFLGVGYTGFEIPLTFNNGLTRTGNNVGLGGNLTQNTTITNNGFNLTTIGAGGTIGLNLSSTGRVSIGTGSTHSIFHISGSGDLGQDLRFDWASNTAAVKPTFMFNRARLNGGVYSAVVDGDSLAMNEISGWTANNAPYTAARWGSNVDGTVSATSVPGNLYFSTTAQGDFGPTERLRITSSGQIGIGTSSPSTGVEIANGALSLSGTNTMGSSTANMYINSRGPSSGIIFTGNLNAFRLFNPGDSGLAMMGGNVGIGTSSPLYQLDVNGQVRISNLPSGSNNYVVTQNGGVLNTRTIDSRVWGSTLSSGTGVLNYSARWLSANTLGTGAIYDNGTRVGIGTASPTATLEVGGTASVISNSSGNMTISAASNLILQPTGGYVGIGTTSPESLLHINPSAVGTSVGNTMVDIRIKQGASSGNISIFDTILRRHTAGSTWSGTNVRLQRTIDVSPMGFIDFGINGISSDQGLGFGSNNTTNMVIKSDGKVGIGITSPKYTLDVVATGTTAVARFKGSGAYSSCSFTTSGTLVCSSDSRLKYNINNISYGLDAISKLRAIDFNWINESANNPKNLGFIAQEVEQIIPELVSVDVDGYKQFNSIGLIPVLTKSIQELNTKIEGLDITSNGSIVVNYNVSPEVLASLGYSGAKNELENGSYSLTDNLGKVVTRVGQFGELAVGKLKAGFISSKAIVTDNLASKNISSETIVTGDLTSTQIGTTQLTALKIGASEASFSTVYADQIINPEGNISDVLATRIGSLRQEIKDLIASNSASESTPSAIAQAATTWETTPATQSADLSGSNLTLTGDLIVGATLTVNGQLTANSAYIADLFTVGQIALKNNILETTADTLYIQPSGLGNINILNNRLVLTADGNIAISGNVTVTGSLTAGLIKAEEIETKKLTAGKINVATSSAVLGLATTSPDATSSAATAGTITLSTGQTEVIITNSQLTPNSMVYLTPNGSTQNQVPYIKNKNDTNFTIAIDTALDHDVNINWWLIN